MIKVGTIFKIKTKTLEDTFGECVYEIVETNIPSKNPEDKSDLVKSVMLGGSGVSARSGMTFFDTEDDLRRWFEDGSAQVIPSEKKNEIIEYYASLEK